MADFVVELAERTRTRGWVGGSSLWSLIERRAEVTPGGLLAHEDTGRELTFGSYREACLRAAAGLFVRHGVGRDTPVSWELPTWNESLVLVGALARLGARQNPLIPIYRDREVGFITDQSRASLLVVPTVHRGYDFEAMAERVAGERPGLSILVADRRLPDADPEGLPEPEAPPEMADGAPIRWVFYTSGTTADPKGAPHSDIEVLASAVAMAECLDIRTDDVAALIFPFTHIGGIGWLMASLVTGCTLLTTESFDPVETPRFLAANGVTLAGSGTPFHLAYLEAQRASPTVPLFPMVRSYPGGGAPKPPRLHYDLKEEIGGVGIVSGYGLTEAPIVAMGSASDPDEKLATTEGRPTPGVDLIVVGPDGRRLPPGVEGEIRLKGPQVISGYLDPALDADAFDGEGYFRTGDLGNVDGDGYVTITGRLKDVIIRNGENISAKEVEDLLYTHPAVADVAVIGLPDQRTGERACAVVALSMGTSLTVQEMAGFLTGAGLRIQSVPERLEVVDVIPRNPAGKILKHELRARFAPASPAPGTNR